MTLRIIIEKATENDSAEMLEYLKLIGAQSDNMTFGAEGIGCTVSEEAEFITRMSDAHNGVLFVARAGGKIVGDASLSRLPRRMSHRGELGIAVLDEYHNQGIGSRLLSEVIDFARDNSFEVIDLEVRCDNAAALALYRKFGFEQIGTHPSFFKINGEHIPFTVMCLNLCDKT